MPGNAENPESAIIWSNSGFSLCFGLYLPEIGQILRVLGLYLVYFGAIE